MAGRFQPVDEAAQIASARLTELGYATVRDYHEGKAEWIEAGLPVEGAAQTAA